jgi:adenylate kinase family enzyme
MYGTQRSVISERAIRAVSALRLHTSSSTTSSTTIVIHDVSRDLIRRVFDLAEDKKLLELFGNSEKDNIERVKAVREKVREQLEPIVCFYSSKEALVDVLVTR